MYRILLTFGSMYCSRIKALGFPTAASINEPTLRWGPQHTCTVHFLWYRTARVCDSFWGRIRDPRAPYGLEHYTPHRNRQLLVSQNFAGTFLLHKQTVLLLEVLHLACVLQYGSVLNTVFTDWDHHRLIISFDSVELTTSIPYAVPYPDRTVR